MDKNCHSGGSDNVMTDKQRWDKLRREVTRLSPIRDEVTALSYVGDKVFVKTWKVGTEPDWLDVIGILLVNRHLSVQKVRQELRSKMPEV